MTNQPVKATKRQALLKLADAHAEEVLAASKSEILDDAAATGMNPEANAQRMRDMLAQVELKVGKAAMTAAQAAIRSRAGKAAPPTPRHAGRGAPSNDAHVMTLAARNGSEQSERDKATIQDDMDELDALIAQREEKP